MLVFQSKLSRIQLRLSVVTRVEDLKVRIQDIRYCMCNVKLNWPYFIFRQSAPNSRTLKSFFPILTRRPRRSRPHQPRRRWRLTPRRSPPWPPSTISPDPWRKRRPKWRPRSSSGWSRRMKRVSFSCFKERNFLLLMFYVDVC